ncbi:MAG: GGDEF domain-containing protein [Mycobacteriaceae bacterium]
MIAVPPLSPAMSFDQASQAVVDYLAQAVPLGLWAVSRFDETDQLYLAVADYTYGKGPARVPWTDTLCHEMVAGAPQIAPDAVPGHAGAGVAGIVTIGTYVGVPILRGDGQRFGTLCGTDPAPHPAAEVLGVHGPLIQLLATLLSTVLEADLARTAALRRAEGARLDAESDVLTGLLNRRGWGRYLAVEEVRYRRFGDPGSVVILDLDRLKEINDRGGHGAGDEHIRLAAHTLRATTRSTDVVARLGGDEFGVVATNTTPENIRALVVRLQQALSAAGVSGSFGHAPNTTVSGFPGAWKAADEAMYAEKARRRGHAQRPPR